MQAQRIAQADFFFGAARRKHVRRPVVAQRGDKLDRHAFFRKPRGDVMPHAARAQDDRADVAVVRNERPVGHAADVQIQSADHNHAFHPFHPSVLRSYFSVRRAFSFALYFFARFCYYNDAADAGKSKELDVNAYREKYPGGTIRRADRRN